MFEQLKLLIQWLDAHGVLEAARATQEEENEREVREREEREEREANARRGEAEVRRILDMAYRPVMYVPDVTEPNRPVIEVVDAHEAGATTNRDPN